MQNSLKIRGLSFDGERQCFLEIPKGKRCIVLPGVEGEDFLISLVEGAPPSKGAHIVARGGDASSAIAARGQWRFAFVDGVPSTLIFDPSGLRAKSSKGVPPARGGLWQGDSLASLLGLETQVFKICRKFARPWCPRCGCETKREGVVEWLERVGKDNRGVVALVSSLGELGEWAKGEMNPVDLLDVFGCLRLVIGKRLLGKADLNSIEVSEKEECAAVWDTFALPLSVEGKHRLESLVSEKKRGGFGKLSLLHFDSVNAAVDAVLSFDESYNCTSCGRSYPPFSVSMLPDGASAGENIEKERQVFYTAGGRRLEELPLLSIDEFLSWVQGLNPQSPAIAGFCEEISNTLENLIHFGLRGISLRQGFTTLSSGELVRLKLARIASSDLSDCVLFFDHLFTCFSENQGAELIESMAMLQRSDNTCICSSECKAWAQAFDWIVDFSLTDDGNVFCGDFEQWLERKGEEGQRVAEEKEADRKHLPPVRSVLAGKPEKPEVRSGAVTLIRGKSGTGKSRWLREMFALESSKRPTAKEAREKSVFYPAVYLDCYGLEYPPRAWLANVLQLEENIANLFALSLEAKLSGFKEEDFIPCRSRFACLTCRGSGQVPKSSASDDSFSRQEGVLCTACNGRGFSSPLLKIKYKGLRIDQVFRMQLAGVRAIFWEDSVLGLRFELACQMALGKVTLKDSWSEMRLGEKLSAGLFVKVNELLTKRKASAPLLVLDGLLAFLSDTEASMVYAVLQRLAKEGFAVVVVDNTRRAEEIADSIIQF